MKENKEPSHPFLDAFLIWSAAIGFLANIIQFVTFTTTFDLFNKPAPVRSPETDPTFLIWNNPIWRGFTFALILYSFVIFTVILQRKVFHRLHAVKAVKFEENLTSLRQMILNLEMAIGKSKYQPKIYDLAFGETLFILLGFFIPLILLWVRVFRVFHPSFLIFTVIYALLSISSTISLLYGARHRITIFFSIVFISPLVIGFLYAQDFSDWQAILLGFLATSVGTVITVMIQYIFSILIWRSLIPLQLWNMEQAITVEALVESSRKERENAVKPWDEKLFLEAQETVKVNPQEAIRKLSILIRHNPESSIPSYIELGKAYTFLGQHEKANESFIKAIELSPKETKNEPLNKIFVFIAEISPEEHICRFINTFVCDPQILPNITSIDKIMYLLNNRRMLIPLELLLQLYLENNPSERTYFQKSQLSFEQGKYRQALQEVNRSIELAGTTITLGTVFLKTKILFELGKYEEAEHILSRLSGKYQYEIKAAILLGHCYIKENRFDEAVKILEITMKMYQFHKWTDYQAFFLAGVAQKEIGNFIEAENYLSTYLQHDPKSFTALLEQGGVRKALKKFDYARDSYDLACLYGKDHLHCWNAWFLFEEIHGDCSSISNVFNKLKERSPELLEDISKVPEVKVILDKCDLLK